jgi:hypothetical protein
LNAENSVVHLAPADQPTTVHQLTERLFGAYTVDGGTVHLAGCHLDDRPFLRLGVRCGDDFREIYLDTQGRDVAGDQIAALGMRETARLEKPPKEATSEIRRLAELGTRLAGERIPREAASEPVEVAVLWCKFAEGKLRFTVDEHTADLPFAGWARALTPPPFVCPRTGRSTFHLAATHDGQIVPADAIELCAETGRPMLAGDLVTCSATGRRVCAELVKTCPICGQPVLRRKMVKCRMCRQRVSPAVTERKLCSACRQLRPIKKADPRMARLLDEHPRLDRWRGWRLSETATVYILAASGWLRRLLLVVDKESLEIKVLATGNRLARGWQIIRPTQYRFVLQE